MKRKLLWCALMAAVSMNSTSAWAQTEEDDTLDTYAEWKAQDTEGMVHVYVPKDSRVAYYKATEPYGDWSDVLFLWDGHDGAEIIGASVKYLFNGETPVVGQRVTGDFNSMFFGDYYYFYYDLQGYPEAYSNLQLGDTATVTPMEATFADVMYSDVTTFNRSYLTLTGTLLYDGNYGTKLKYSLYSVNIDATFVNSNLDFLKKYDKHNIKLTGFLSYPNNDVQPSFSLVDTTGIVDLGMPDAEPVSFDADKPNNITETTVADVTIRNMNLKAGEYNLVTLPFTLFHNRFAEILGENAKVYNINGYMPTDSADVLIFRDLDPDEDMTAGFAYLVKADKDIDSLTVKGVSIPAPDLYEHRIFNVDYESDIERTISYAPLFNPVNTANVADAYVLDPSTGKLVKNATAKAFSAYIVDKDATPYMKVDGTILDPDAPSTGIREISAKSSRSGKIFNLNGMEVTSPLAPGIYIQDGKKIMKY